MGGKMVNLKRPSESVAMNPSDKMEPMGPMVHIDGVDLPLKEEHVGKEISAEVKMKVHKAGSEVMHGSSKKEKSYRLEMTGIKIT